MYKKYRMAYLSFALAACLLIGFFVLFFSISQLNRSVQAHEEQRMELAASWLEDQMELLKEIGYQIKITAYYKPVYFERNGLYAQDLMDDLAKYQGYSPVIGDIKLYYKKTPDFIFGVQHKSRFSVWAENALGVTESGALKQQLCSVSDQTAFYPSGLTDTVFVAQLLEINGSRDPSGDAVLIFVLPVEQMLSAMQRVSGVDRERLCGLCWKGAELFAMPTDSETLTVHRDNCTLVMRAQDALANAEILSLSLGGLVMIAVVLVVLAICAVVAARHNYKPIASLADRFDLKPENEFAQIEHLLMDMHETNRTSQQEMTVVLGQLQSQKQKLRSHLMLLLLTGTSMEATAEQLESVGLCMKYALFCAVALQLQSPLEEEALLIRDVESLSDDQVQLSAVRISRQEHFAVIVNADDAYTILSQKDMLQDVLDSLGITASIGMGEMVRSAGKLAYSMQTALYGLYQGEAADVSMFSGGAVQQMLDMAESGHAEESRQMFASLFQLVVQSYPLKAMQQNILLQIADKLNELAVQCGFSSQLAEIRRLLMMGATDQFSRRIGQMIDGIAAATESRRRETERRDVEKVQELLAYLQANACDSQFSQELVADRFGISERQVGRLVKETIGVSYKEYVVNIKIEAAKELLRQNLSVSETCMRIGYTNIPHFIKKFKEKTGITPGNWKAGV